MGLITLPYVFFFEFLAPVIEMFGFLFTIYLILAGGVNFGTAWIMLLFIYVSGLTLSFITMRYEKKVNRLFTSKEYFRLGLFVFIEPLLYHPLIVFFSIKGYIDFMTKKNFTWGEMTRQGFDNNTSKGEVKQTLVTPIED